MPAAFSFEMRVPEGARAVGLIIPLQLPLSAHFFRAMRLCANGQPNLRARSRTG
jgi:hypothetical protein